MKKLAITTRKCGILLRKINKSKNINDKKIEYLTENQDNIYETEYIANIFNKFVSSIGSKLAKK